MAERKFSFGLVPAVLVAICITGALAVPFGDPRLLVVAIPVEMVFVSLAILSAAGYQKALYACLPLAAVVMVGNSLAPPHVQIMTTFSKPLNAVLLIIGGYVLQVALIVSALYAIVKRRRAVVQESGESTLEQ